MASLNGLVPWARPAAEEAVAWAVYYRVPVQVTSVYRSIADQARLYARRASNPYPVAKPGNSAHNWGMAWDSWVPEQYWPWWTYVRTSLGWEVLPGDRIHAQVPGWRSYVR